MDARGYLDEQKAIFGVKTDEELAVLIDTSVAAMSKWVQRNKIPDKWEYKIRQMSMSVSEPKQKYSLDAGNIEIPLVKLQAGAGSGVYNFEPQNTLVSLNPLLFPFVSAGKAIAVEIIGDSMEPTLRNGDYIIITPNIQDRRDDGIYVISRDGTVKVKSLHFKLDGTIDIISNNPKYPTETYDPSENQIPFDIIGSLKLHISR